MVALPCQDNPSAWLGPTKGTSEFRNLTPAERAHAREVSLRSRLTCFTCPLRRQCLESELRWPVEDQHHIFGGYTGGERRGIKDGSKKLGAYGERRVKPKVGARMLRLFLTGVSIPEVAEATGYAARTVENALYETLAYLRFHQDSDILGISEGPPESSDSVHAA